MLRIVWLFTLISLFVAVSAATTLKNGDLIFQLQGAGALSDAIARSTASADSLKIVHVGIIEVTASGEVNVIEASSEEGVRVIPLSEFVAESPKIDGKPALIVKRLTLPFPASDAIFRAKAHLGEPYDWLYLPDNGAMYCSELVYDSYRDADGNPIFESEPMNFRASDGTMPEFWVRLYSEAGIDIPEGLPGTNPNSLSKHPSLIPVPSPFSSSR